jgi:uncharacterized protein YbjT (DUF2867 family)
MDKKEKIILVTGATGQQGGAAARQLLKDGWKVRAFVRDENKPAAAELKELGAELFIGDLNNRNSVNDAMKNAYGVFSVQNFYEAGYDGELKQGQMLIDLAKENKVSHFLQTTVAGADKAPDVPHFEVKARIEDYLKKSGIKYTILRPVFFMENFNTWFTPQHTDDGYQIAMGMQQETKLQMIAVDDIGKFVVEIFNNPDKYLGQSLEIAGDELTMPEVAKAYTNKLGKDVKFVSLPIDAVKQYSQEVGAMFEWFQKHGYEANINELKKVKPELKTFNTWVNNQ